MLGFDPRSLETKGRYSFKNAITSLGGIELFSTAHPHLRKEKRTQTRSQDKESALKEGGNKKEEELFTYNYYFELRPIALPGLPPTNLAHIVRINGEGHREIVGTVPVEGNSIPYVHDFSMTENYIILCLWPVRIEMSKMVTSDRGFLRELDWCKADKTGKQTM
jgi:carotenoid cleavage dioxygenase-like enzyme